VATFCHHRIWQDDRGCCCCSSTKMTNTEAHVRLAALDEVDQLERLDLAAWGSRSYASAEKWRSRIEIFPEGTIVCTGWAGAIEGVFSFLRRSVEVLEERDLSWREATGNGYITTHEPSGEIAFGVTLSVPKSRPGTSRKLIEAGQEACRQSGLKGIFFGSRIPRYHRYADLLTAQEYVELATPTNIDGRRVVPDGEVALYKRYVGARVIRLVPNFFNDPNSLNWGVLMGWEPAAGRRGPL
jgi:hypothetical protein